MSHNIVRYSKFISRVLRHQPQMIGLTLDESGWAEVDSLLEDMNAKGLPIDRGLLERVVADNDKQRFAFNADGTKIRANQGHSINIDLGLQPQAPPDLLYHDTALKNLDSIRRQGLLKGRRQFVHLSLDTETAVKVGRATANRLCWSLKPGEWPRTVFSSPVLKTACGWSTMFRRNISVLKPA